jgi:DNA-binding transcriptional LysR family regulator
MTPTSTELTYFAEIFRTKHVSAAAVRLGIRQPTLTQSLANLEKKIGVRLFHRSGRGMVPTRAGEKLYSRARTLLGAWQELESDFRVSREGLAGRFRVGAHPSVASYCLPRMLENLERRAPKIELELVHDSSRKITEKVIGYEVDLAFIVNPARRPELTLKKIGEDRVKFFVANGKSKPPKRLFCDLSLAQVESILGKSGSEFREWTIVQSSSLELVRTLVANGHGVGILPERVARAEGADLKAFREADLPTFADTIYLAYRKEVFEDATSKALLESARISLD